MTFDDHIAVRTLYGEVRGVPEEGQKAVCHVLRNRLASGKFGKTIAQVCLQHASFSCWMQDTNDLPDWKAVTSCADDDPMLIHLAAIWLSTSAEPDFTGGATHYFATTMPKAPIWTLGAKLTGQWGGQKFWTGVV